MNLDILNNETCLVMVNNTTAIPFRIEDYTLYLHPMLVNLLLTVGIGCLMYGFLIATICYITMYLILPIELKMKEKKD